MKWTFYTGIGFQVRRIRVRDSVFTHLKLHELNLIFVDGNKRLQSPEFVLGLVLVLVLNKILILEDEGRVGKVPDSIA